MDTKEQPRLVTGLFTRARHRTTRVAIEQEFITTDTSGLPVPIDLVRRAAGTPTTTPSQPVRRPTGAPTTTPSQPVRRPTGAPTTPPTQSAGRSTSAPITQPVRPSTGAAAYLSFEP